MNAILHGCTDGVVVPGKAHSDGFLQHTASGFVRRRLLLGSTAAREGSIPVGCWIYGARIIF